MKTLRLFTYGLISIICLCQLTGCDDDDDEDLDNPLIGTWIYEDATSDYRENMTFKADGTWVGTIYYSYQGTNASINVNATYTYKDNIITLISENSVYTTYEVISITSDKLTVQNSEGITFIYHRA